MPITDSPSTSHRGLDDLQQRRERLGWLLFSLRRLAGRRSDEAPHALRVAIAGYEAELSEVRQRIARIT
jgi:hypothetical protein